MTGGAAASPVIGTAAAGHPSPGALVQLPKAQLQALARNPGQYVKRTGAFIPGTIAGLATAAGNIGATAITGDPHYAKGAFKSLVASNKEFAGYLSGNPKVQRALAEKYGAGPFAIGALSVRGARRARQPARLGKAARGRYNVGRLFSMSRGYHESLSHEAIIHLYTDRTKRAGKVVRRKSVFARLPSQSHRDAAILTSEGNISVHVPRQAERQLAEIIRRDPEAAATPGTEAHAAAWLYRQVRDARKQGKNFLAESGVAAASKRFRKAQEMTGISTKTLRPIEQRVAANRPLMIRKGIIEPKERAPGFPGKTREGLEREAKAHERRARTLSGQIRELRGKASLKSRNQAKYRAQIDHLVGQRKAETRLAQEKRTALKQPTTDVERTAALREVGQVRRAEKLPPAGFLSHEDIRQFGQDTSIRARPGRPAASRRIFRRRGRIEASGFKTVSEEQAIRGSFIKPSHINALRDISEHFAKGRSQGGFARELTTQDVKAMQAEGATFRTTDPTAQLTMPQIEAGVRAGIFDPKTEVALPLNRVTKELQAKNPDVAGIVADLSIPARNEGIHFVGGTKHSPGTRYQIFDRNEAREFAFQTAGTPAIAGGRAAIAALRKFNRFQSRLVLSTSLGFVPMQVIAEGVPAALSGNPLAWGKYWRSWERLTPETRAAFQAGFGATYGFMQVMRAYEKGSLRFDAKTALKGSQAAAHTYAGRLVRGKANPLDAMQQLDAWKGNKFRVATGFSEMQHLTAGRMLKRQGDAWKLTDEMIRRIKTARKQSPAALAEEVAKHPRLMEAIHEAVRDVLGDWNTLTRKEQLPAALGFFYPMLRYTTRFILHGFPKRHPAVATVVYTLGMQNSQEVRRLLGGDDPDFLAPLMQGVLYSPGGEQPINVARASPGGQAIFELGINGLDLASVTKFFQPAIGIGAAALGATDPFTGNAVVPPGAVQTAGGEVLVIGKDGKPHKLGLGIKGAIAGAALLRLPAGVRLGEQLIGNNPRPKPYQLPFLAKAQTYPAGPESQFYNAVLQSGRGKAIQSAFPPVSGQSFQKQRALNRYIRASKQKKFGAQYVAGLQRQKIQKGEPITRADVLKWTTLQRLAQAAELEQLKLQGQAAQGRFK